MSPLNWNQITAGTATSTTVTSETAQISLRPPIRSVSDMDGGMTGHGGNAQRRGRRNRMNYGDSSAIHPDQEPVVGEGAYRGPS